MKGYIKIESATREGKAGLCVDTKLQEVSLLDRVVVIGAVCQSLDVSPTELKLIAGVLEAGFMREMTEQQVIRDNSEVAPKSERDDLMSMLAKLLS